MGYGSGKLDMSHSFAPYFSAGDFDAASFAGDALVTDTLILSAVAFPVLHRSKDAFAEKSVLFGLLRSVVYGFGLGYLALGKFPDFFGGSYADFDRTEII